MPNISLRNVLWFSHGFFFVSEIISLKQLLRNLNNETNSSVQPLPLEKKNNWSTNGFIPLTISTDGVRLLFYVFLLRNPGAKVSGCRTNGFDCLTLLQRRILFVFVRAKTWKRALKSMRDCLPITVAIQIQRATNISTTEQYQQTAELDNWHGYR